VGSFNTLNALTAAFTEQLPVILVNGAPTNDQLQKYKVQDVLSHHMIEVPSLFFTVIRGSLYRTSDFKLLQLGITTQKEIFSKVTAEAFIVDHPEIACRQIDEAITRCVFCRLPVS